MGTNEKGGNNQLLESVLKAKNWPALADLKNGTPSGRRAIVTNVFEEACVHHDDEVALQWFNWLLLAITEEGEPNLEPVETTDWKAQDETKARLVCRQAEAIKALYPELPRFREEPARYAGESGAILSTLLKTKKAMLETIAVGWRAAPTNEAGDEFFTFISKTDSTLRDGVGDRELINETIRRVTGSDFPLTRLMYTLRNHPGAYTDILAHAWVKNAWRYGSRGSSSSLILAAVGDFYEASPEATKLLERVGAKILKRYDPAQTPYQRLLAADALTTPQRQALQRQFLALNPAALARQITQTLETLWTLSESQRVRKQSKVG